MFQVDKKKSMKGKGDENLGRSKKKSNMFEQKNVHLVQMLSCFAFPLKSWRIFQVQFFAVDLCWCFDGSNSANHLRLQVGPNTSENSRVMQPFFILFLWFSLGL